MKTPYIGFFRRAAAFIIDFALITLPATMICIPLLSRQYTSDLPLPDPQAQKLLFEQVLGVILFLWQVVFLLTYWLYFSFLESSSKQATLGKMLLGIKVVDQQGNRLRFAHATGRTFARILSFATFYIGFVMAGCTHRKRALHDMIAQTYVVRKDFQPQDELPESDNHPVWLAVWCVVLCTLPLL